MNKKKFIFCASYLAQSGVSLIQIEYVLNHKQISVNQGYDHLFIEHREIEWWVVFNFILDYNRCMKKLLLLLLLLMWFINYDKIDCYLHAEDFSKCSAKNNWEY